MANKDLSQNFLSAMSGNKKTVVVEDSRTTNPSVSAIPSLVKENSAVSRKLTSIYLTEEEYEILKEFAAKNGFTRKVRDQEVRQGNLSKLLQSLAQQLKEDT